MNHQQNGFPPPPFFPNGSRPPFNPMVGPPGAFSRPPPPFPPRFGPPAGPNGFNNHNSVRPNGFNNHNSVRPNGFNSHNNIRPPGFNTSVNVRPNSLNNHNHNNNVRPNGFNNNVQPNGRFTSPPPNSRFTSPPPPIPASARRPRPVFTPDTIFSPPPNMAPPSSSEGFPFSGGSHQPHPPRPGPPPSPQPNVPRGGRGGARGRGAWGSRGRGGFANNRKQQGTNLNKKKDKVNKKDLAENNVYFCDTCDRGFKAQEKYQEHVDGHIKCSYKDCPFTAAPKLVQMHISLQHRTGMAKKIWSIESEEDVKKWREERKRKFPTAENIAKKKEEEAQRIARGEVLETKDFSAMRGGRGRGRGRGRGDRWRGRGQNRRGRGGRGGRFYSPGDDDSMQDEDKDKVDKDKAEDADDDGPPEEVAIAHRGLEPAEEAGSKGDNDNSGAAEEGTALSPEPGEGAQSESVLEAGSPNTSSLGLLASYGFSSSEGEASDGEEAETGEQTRHALESAIPGPLTEAEEEWQPSPSKKPRLLHNPFTAQTNNAASTQPQACHPTAAQAESVSPSKHSCAPSSIPPNGNLAASSGLVHRTPASSRLGSPTSEATSGKTKEDGEQLASPGNVGSGETEARDEQQEGAAEMKSDGSSVSGEKLNNEPEEGGKHEASQRGKRNQGNVNRDEGARQNQRAAQDARKKGAVLPKYTLLEKLLASDIRRERNKILQCVHYIVQNKFFDTVPTAAGECSAPSTPAS